MEAATQNLVELYTIIVKKQLYKKLLANVTFELLLYRLFTDWLPKSSGKRLYYISFVCVFQILINMFIYLVTR